MAGQYVSYNSCTLAVDTAWGDVYLEGYRKGLYTQLFFIFFIYFITQVLHAFRYKNSQVNPNSVRQSLAAIRISQVRASQCTTFLTQNPQKKIPGLTSHGTNEDGTDISLLSFLPILLPWAWLFCLVLWQVLWSLPIFIFCALLFMLSAK